MRFHPEFTLSLCALFEGVALFGVVVLYLIVNTWPNHDRLRDMVFSDQGAGMRPE